MDVHISEARFCLNVDAPVSHQYAELVISASVKKTSNSSLNNW